MRDTRLFRLVAPLAALGLVLCVAVASPAYADELGDAKALYAAASFEEALAMLDKLDMARNLEPEVQQYRALCMLALGRTQDAERVVGQLVVASPTFVPPLADSSPRFVTLFTETRRRTLPDITRRIFNEARERYHAKAHALALKQFEEVLALSVDPIWNETPDATDLRSLAAGFADLSRAALTASAPAAVPPSAPSATPAASGPAPVSRTASSSPAVRPPTPSANASGTAPAPAATVPARAGAPTPASAANPDVSTTVATSAIDAPVAVQQTLPVWVPPDARAGARDYTGAVRVLIGLDGRVKSATIERRTHPAYDTQLLQVARMWVYRPALLNGQPVEAEKVIEFQLRARQ